MEGREQQYDSEAVGPTWLTREEVAQRTRFTVKTLANWAAQHPPKGPRFVKVGSRCRYPLADLVAWQQAQGGEAA
ncbi:helix-turn-helix domain-containing protein [Nocardia otitidiscaviarum]|uniref:Helix-turn-helix domain-containing protein n=1 Tax=Nocardia otitidiscaviarum TaxID=1823 RepID=A0A516NIY5_9NOCA|nr:helix-turn-helix domain-containing protein [Nocardia otitidiscaviarum]MCP9619688.1 helix-turn-helix domain-containing protein [Nocardia otitidiscaviarum]QDP78870.1 helix-turn-helix domain-containing protein [Nocardia otitidiscaviarum]